ncbi:hypothetical protein PoHVEF18_008384 [Penicillium ochrochloron]
MDRSPASWRLMSSVLPSLLADLDSERVNRLLAAAVRQKDKFTAKTAGITVDRVMHMGQIHHSVLDHCIGGKENPMGLVEATFSLESDGLLIMHAFPDELSYGRQFICSERGILYAFVEDGNRYAVGTSKTMPGTSDEYNWQDWTVHRMVDVDQRLRMFEDAQFLVFLGQSTLEVWIMEEKPTGPENQYGMMGLSHN